MATDGAGRIPVLLPSGRVTQHTHRKAESAGLILPRIGFLPRAEMLRIVGACPGRLTCGSDDTTLEISVAHAEPFDVVSRDRPGVRTITWSAAGNGLGIVLESFRFGNARFFTSPEMGDDGGAGFPLDGREEPHRRNSRLSALKEPGSRIALRQRSFWEC